MNKENNNGNNGRQMLDTEALGNVSGGKGAAQIKAHCPVCKRTTAFTVFSGGRGYCTVCGHARTDL